MITKLIKKYFSLVITVLYSKKKRETTKNKYENEDCVKN